MATREKKPSLNRKQNTSSPQPSKENNVNQSNETKNDEQTMDESATPLPVQISNNVKTSPKTATKKFLTKNPKAKLAKKPLIKIKLKPKIGTKTVKINQKLVKAMLGTKNPDNTKRRVLKNGVKTGIKLARASKKKDGEEPKMEDDEKMKVKNDDLPPVLEPIYPLDDNMPKAGKKRLGRPPGSKNIPKKIKLETERTKRIRRAPKKITEDHETIDDVMNDLSYLIENERKKEVENAVNEPIKPKKMTKKRRLELIQSLLKKENIENANASKVIDMLDLNVNKLKKTLPKQRRRHSIEKFPLGENTETGIELFSTLPRCLSPRSKRLSRVRQSVDGLNRRLSPYSTRSDTTATRILRNGKHRKLNLMMLEGYDGTTTRKRRRNCSDVSGSEISKISGYESDSSFSDFSSLQGESKDPVDVKPKVENLEENLNDTLTDNNSNLCGQIKTEIKDEAVNDGAIMKVPEKSLILDSMKQTFNHSEEPKEPADAEEKDVAVAEVNVPPEPDAEEGRVDNVENGDVKAPVIEETPEEQAIKENILQALGLQSLKAAEEAKLKHKEKVAAVLPKNDPYTGTLKTVIKINRDRKKGRNPLKMTLQKNKMRNDCDTTKVDDKYKIMKDTPTSQWKSGGQSSDTAGAHRKSHYSNRSNMEGSSEHTSDGESGTQDGPTKALVIPEKASSFSIHPGRLCKDVCTYCFGKFGLFDTPCHIGQMKSVDRQDRILAVEKHLTRDSCLCDACFRHVDRKANTPSFPNNTYRRKAMVAPGPKQDDCHVLGCKNVATNILRRKWIIKMKKSICEVINIDLNNPGLHSIPICSEHYSALEHLMVCAMCKRRLARNHVHYLGPEINDLNAALNSEGIPLTLADKPVVCKLCKCFTTVILKPPDERPENSSDFFQEYKKRLLHFNDIVPMDEAAAEEPITVPSKESPKEKDSTNNSGAQQQIKRKRRSRLQIENDHSSSQSSQLNNQSENDQSPNDQSCVPSSDLNSQSRSTSPSDYMIDYNTLIPSIALECGSDDEVENKKKSTKKTQQQQQRPETVKEAVEISKNMKVGRSDNPVQKLGSNPSISVRQLFPYEEELQLQANIDFGNVKERTPEGWEKCTSVIQYDLDTKNLWQELQKPYGNQSSFLRHLILLEKYFRNGDLVLSPNASHHSINYSESVHNRLKAYDNIPSSSNYNSTWKKNYNAANLPKNTPITLSQLNSSTTLIPSNLSYGNKTKNSPPGLISINANTNKQLAKMPQSHKFKFPLTKNWRPNLIPIDPTKKPIERKPGVVQVISGGKPYHITIEDYKKMCTIKKNFELKQRKLQQESMNKTNLMKNNNVTLIKYNSNMKNVAKKNVSTKSASEQEMENSLEKLDQQVERLEAKFNEDTAARMALPKIPKSLTVIPQTVTRKPSRPASPVLLITQKNKS